MLQLTMDTIGNLANIGMSILKTTADITGAIEKIKEKTKAFDGMTEEDKKKHKSATVEHERRIAEGLEVCTATVCMCGLLDPRWLMRARAVSQSWRQAVDKALPHLQKIAFPVHVTGVDVLTMLMPVAGTNLKKVCLEGCRQLSGDDMERILVRVAEGCPAVVEIKLTDCGEEAILRALATAAKRQLGAVSPADLREMLLSLAEGDATFRS